MFDAPRRSGPAWRLAWVLGLGLAVTACTNRSATGELTPPSGSPKWESRFRDTFDDDYTAEAINLQGRAPHDVRDQRLFAARLGHAQIVAQVTVQQVWGRGRYQGRQQQFLEVEFDKLLIGELVKGTAERQLIQVEAEDELPGSLQGQSLILFVRWAPGDQPPYHHHLMPVEAEAMGYIGALIEHAKSEGVLNAEGAHVEEGRRGRKKKRREGKKASKEE